MIEKQNCSRGYYYGVIDESIINYYWQPRKQNKKKLQQRQKKIRKNKIKKNYNRDRRR